jgi:hypothetical protein
MTGTDDPREPSLPAAAVEGIAPEWFQTLEPAMRRIARDVVQTYRTEIGHGLPKINAGPGAGYVFVQDVRPGTAATEFIEGMDPDVVRLLAEAAEDPQVLEASRIFARIHSELPEVEARADRLLERYKR